MYAKAFLSGAGVILLVTMLGAVELRAETATNGVVANTPVQLKQRALELEQAGRKVEAARIYEQIIQAEPAARLILAQRLVRIYAETQQPEKALAWARQAMQTNPDPQAYLAGVHTRLGHYAAARKILDAELGQTTERRHKLLLNWQLAEVCAQAGDREAAGRALRAASELAQEPAEKKAAELRLRQFEKESGAK